MDTNNTLANSFFWRSLRWWIWGGAAALLSLPLIAMQFTGEVNWTASDFVVMGVMLGAVCTSFELALRMARSPYYMLAAGLAAGAAFLVTWSNLAVGIIGNEDNPANWMFFAVVAIALIGSLLSRLQPTGMARTMRVTAAVQAITAVAALVLDDVRVFVTVSVFAGMWLLSSALFAKAAQQTASTRIA